MEAGEGGGIDAVELATAYRTQGYVHLRGFVPPGHAAELAAAVAEAPERTPGRNPLTLGTMRFASNLFYGSTALQRFLAGPPVLDLVRALIGGDAWVRWDQAVWKEHGAPEFPLHQDNGYTGLGHEHLQLWVALTPSTTADGGLLVVPGGHRAPLPHRWIGDHVTTDPPGPTVALEAEAGDVVAFSSLLPHATAPNTSGRTRLAYVAELLPLSVDDPSVPEPHLVVVEDGRASGRFAPRAVHRPAPDRAP